MNADQAALIEIDRLAGQCAAMSSSLCRLGHALAAVREPLAARVQAQRLKEVTNTSARRARRFAQAAAEREATTQEIKQRIAKVGAEREAKTQKLKK